METHVTKPDLSALSDDARYFGSSMFCLMTPGHGQLTFQMIESKPSARSQAALEELVAKGFVSVEPFSEWGGLVYRPLVEFPAASQAMGKRLGPWAITEKITRPDSLQ